MHRLAQLALYDDTHFVHLSASQLQDNVRAFTDRKNEKGAACQDDTTVELLP
jgi:hypothetical protein